VKRFALPSAIAALCLSVCAGSAAAQDAPPEPPPPADPQPEEPGLVWEKTWQAARTKGNALNGYTILWVTADKQANGEEAVSTHRLLNSCWSVPQINQKITPLFGCFRGTFDECKNAGAGQQMTAAGVTAGPAIIIVDPSDGDVVDVLPGAAQFMEVLDLVDKVDRGLTRKGCELKLENKDRANDPELNLAYGQALVRAGDTDKARTHFAKSAKSPDLKQSVYSRIGIAVCDLKDRKFKDAIDKAGKIFEELPPNAQEPRAECLYIMTWAYYGLKELDDASKNAEMLTTRYLRTTWGWKLLDDQADIGWDFVKKEKIDPK